MSSNGARLKESINTKRGSITRQHATDRGILDVSHQPETIKGTSGWDEGKDESSANSTYAPNATLTMTCEICGRDIHSTPLTNQCAVCVETLAMDELQTTLKIPTNRHRCDSGNGSDLTHSPGNVSPSSSDYGGGGGADRNDTGDEPSPTDNTRKHSSEDSSCGSPANARDVSIIPTVPEDQRLGPPTAGLLLAADSPPILPTQPPMVKVWPAVDGTRSAAVDAIPSTQTPGGEGADDSLDTIMKRTFITWQIGLEHNEEWGEETTSSSASADVAGADPSYHHRMYRRRASQDPLLDDRPVGGTAAALLHRQMSEGSESVFAMTVSSHLSSGNVDSLPGASVYHSRGLSRQSVDSLSSLDGYFSQIHHNHQLVDEYDVSNSTASAPTSTTKPSPGWRHEPSSQSNQRSKNSSKISHVSTRAVAPALASRTISEDGTSSTSPKSTRRRTLRERLSEQQLQELKLDVRLQAPVSAPTGDDQVNSMFSSYQSDASGYGSALNTPSTPTYLEQIKDPTKRWQALKGIMPFMESYKRHKWVQLAGHQGSFEQGAEDSLVLKKFCRTEHAAFTKLYEDPLHSFIPKYHGMTDREGTQYVELENLLHGFNSPSVMDCKIGMRTYLEEELRTAERCPKPRADMYEKIMKIDPSEPTAEEHAAKAVSKPRYMQWREDISSTSTLGFRIEGIKCSDGQCCINFKTSKDVCTIKTIVSGFLSSEPNIIKQCLNRLKELRKTLDQSHFFQTHELIGSSLLFVHDNAKAGVWMIDFGKTTPLEEGVVLTHCRRWERGNHEDGYLTGLENLTHMLEEILEEAVDRRSAMIQQRLQTSGASHTELSHVSTDSVNHLDCPNVTASNSGTSYSTSPLS